MSAFHGALVKALVFLTLFQQKDLVSVKPF